MNQFEMINHGLLVRAPGKINLSLLVAGKRADGFHNIESIMAKIDWYDEIVIERDTRSLILDSRKKETQIELVCKGEYKVPEGEENLVYKAARMILDFVSPKRDSAKGFGFRIRLRGQ
jgi:4-diphosphocytidyl-2-C-methyl-D-erythritol kinase